MRSEAAKSQLFLVRIVIALLMSFIVIGAVWYGFSAEVRQRVWQNLLDRPGGPMTFRFILQPIMAAAAALRDGIKDAKASRSPYFWTVLTDPAERVGRLKEGLIATARIILLGLIVSLPSSRFCCAWCSRGTA